MGADPVAGNGVAKLFFGVLSLMAEFERERILERTLEGRNAKRAKGGHVGGSAPFGYRVKGSGKDARLVKDEEQQTALRTMRELRGQGLSFRKIETLVEAQHGLRVSREAIRRVCKAA